jgi:hypothetical protein
MENLSELIIILTWVLKEILTNILDKKNHKVAIKDNSKVVERNSLVINELMKDDSFFEKKIDTYIKTKLNK